MKRPMQTHASAGISCGGPMVSPPNNRVTSSNPTGTRRAPRMAPTLLPRPPTMTAANRMMVSGYSQVDGAQTVRKPTRIAPESPAIAPPTMKIVIFKAVGFFPSAEAATSFSRIARRDLPYGELTIRAAMNQTMATQIAVRPI